MKPKPDNRNIKAECLQYNSKKTEDNIKRSNDIKAAKTEQKANIES